MWRKKQQLTQSQTCFNDPNQSVIQYLFIVHRKYLNIKLLDLISKLLSLFFSNILLWCIIHVYITKLQHLLWFVSMMINDFCSWQSVSSRLTFVPSYIKVCPPTMKFQPRQAKSGCTYWHTNAEPNEWQLHRALAIRLIKK